MAKDGKEKAPLDEIVEKLSDEETDDDENAFQGKEIIIETENAMADVQAAMDKHFEAGSNERIESLNDDQKRVFDRVMGSFEEREEKSQNFCLFVSGQGGTGKSFLIETISNAVRNRFKNAGSVAIAAPTGLAALNIDGVTLQRLLMLPVDHGKIAEYHSLSSDNVAIMKGTLGQLKLLIIDEISMVSSVILAYVHLRINEFFELNKPFGGEVSVLVLGDFLQLPPVQGNPAFVKVTGQEARLRFNSLGGSNLWNFFQYDELTQNVRQAEDQSYGNILSRIRIGKVTAEDVAILESRVVPGGKDIREAMNLFLRLFREGQTPLCLMPKLEMCEKFNFQMLQQCQQPVERLTAEDRLADYDKKMTKNIVKRFQMLDKEASKTGGLESELLLCVGCRVMVRRNISFEEGIVNGTMGVVQEFRRDDRGKVNGIYIKIDANSKLFLLERISVKFLLMAKTYVKRSQFPVILAYAITIHKSQGMSLKCAILDLGPHLFGTVMAYVALSRVTSLSGLHLLQFDPSKIKADQRAIIEYNRLRKKSSHMHLYKPFKLANFIKLYLTYSFH